MTIKEVEEQTGLARSNIRFYEKEKLIKPARNARNGYREYSEKDVEDLKKIAYLRTLEIPLEDIRKTMSHGITLTELLEKQAEVLRARMESLNQARILCERMLEAGNVSYDRLQVEAYTKDLEGYWNENKPVLRLDSVSFLYLWGSFTVWAAITALCLAVGAAFYAKLPPEIPVQWNGGEAVSFADKRFIFAYPPACVAIRFLLRPVLYNQLLRNWLCGELIAEYLSNFLCFLALSIEIFSILFLYGLAENVVMVLAADTAIFAVAPFLFAGIPAWERRRRRP